MPALTPRNQIRGGIVATVLSNGIASEIGVEPGDILRSINGHPLRDQIDYQFYSAEEDLTLVIMRDGVEHEIEIERDYDEELGITFIDPVFDGMRMCRNNCPFCFVNQMPKGMRRTLYVHDDDYRYSFLLGNFVTLTNLDDSDWQRIQEQHLSPLFVSIHATDLALRRQLLGNPHAGDIMIELQRLLDWGIEVHGQIVLVPGINDGEALQHSIGDLLTLKPGLGSLALVPVGLTKRHRKGLRTMNPHEAERVLGIAQSFAPDVYRRYGRTWLYPSDELYLLARRLAPDARFYDDPAQKENGVGLTRELLDDWQALVTQDKWPSESGTRLTWACGTLIAPVLQEIAHSLQMLAGVVVDVVPVENRFFGESVTVSGLLTGQDLVHALEGHKLGQRLCLPRVMFDETATFTLDDMSLDTLERTLDVPIQLVATVSDVLYGHERR